MTFVRHLWSLRPALTTLVLLLTLVAGMLQGVGILLLLPMLELAGIDTSLHAEPSAQTDPTGTSVRLPLVLAAFVCLVALHSALIRIQAVLTSRLQVDITMELRNRLHKSMLHMEWREYMRIRLSDVTQALTHDAQRVGQGVLSLVRTSSGIVIAIIYLLLSLVISPLLTGITLGCVLLLTLFVFRFNQNAVLAGTQLSKTMKTLHGEISDHLAGMREVRSFGDEERSSQEFRSLTSDVANCTLYFTRLSETVQVISKTGASVLLCLLVYCGILFVETSPGEILVLVYLFARTLPRLGDIHRSYHLFLHTLPAFESIAALQGRCDEHRGCSTTCGDSQCVIRVESSVELINLGFQYDNSWALRNVDMRIAAGKTTAMMGLSGSGKSTIADLLMGLLSPSEGAIHVDGKPLTKPLIPGWRRSIGYVPQRTYLHNASIRDNLAWAAPGTGDPEMWTALELASAAEFVRNLPHGIDTRVGERGTCLSGGECQRLALARALLRQPSLLILDEATSSLDRQNEERIHQAITDLHGKVTIVMIAHDISTVRCADHIIVLHDGGVAETGTFDELSKRDHGYFQSLPVSTL